MTYELNYDWSLLGPTRWTEDSIVTLQVDFHSDDAGHRLAAATSTWWDGLDKAADPELFGNDAHVGIAGGCRFPKPIRVTDYHVTAWVVSRGEDAFDSIAHYANELYGVALSADPSVRVTWTELPHYNPSGLRLP